MKNTKARQVFAASTRLAAASYYRPGERAAGPLAMFACIDKGAESAAGVPIPVIFSLTQGTKFVRQNQLSQVSLEQFDTGSTAEGAGPYSGTLAGNPQPGSVVVTTEDNSGFTAAETTNTLTDDGNGKLVNQAGVARGTINYFTKAIAVTFGAAVTNGQKVYATYMPGVVCTEGVKLIALDQFKSEDKIEFKVLSKSKTQQGWYEIFGYWR